MSADIDRNKRIRDRYDELMHIGKRGHYETMFQIVKEEVERERAKWVAKPQAVSHATVARTR